MYLTSFPSLIKFKTLSLNFENIDVSLFRLFIGLCGSLFFFALFEIMYTDNKLFIWLSKVGINSLAIYLLQKLILEDLTDRIIDFPNINLWVYNLLVTPFVSFVILVICLIIMVL